jgi:hypothetical protein
MEKKIIRICGIIFLILVFVSLVVFGCRQAPPPAQTPPPAGSAQMPAPAGNVQTPAPAGNVQMPAGGSAQMPAPAGTVSSTQAGTPSRDANQVLVGMTPEQVQQIMGSPDQLYQKGFIEWKYNNPQGGRVDIRFQNNKVLLVETYKKP